MVVGKISIVSQMLSLQEKHYYACFMFGGSAVGGFFLAAEFALARDNEQASAFGDAFALVLRADRRVPTAILMIECSGSGKRFISMLHHSRFTLNLSLNLNIELFITRDTSTTV